MRRTLAMSVAHKHLALALAHALLAGERRPDALAARLQACTGQRAPWQGPLAERLARLPGEHWRRLTPRSLAAWLLRDAGCQQAWAGAEPPAARRYILRVARQQAPLPLALEAHAVPHWPHAGALAETLGLTPAALWRLTRPAAWQRRDALGEGHHLPRLLPKRRGGFRLLEVPQPYLMALQRKLLDGLLQRIPPHEACCGYVAGRSVVDHAHAHAGQPVLLCFDLQDFFASVKASRVHALFATLGYAEPVARALTALCTTATPEPVLRRLQEAGQLSWQQAQRLRDAHLPQGAPTSPALANLCAFGLDLRLDGLARALEARYTRYADDLVISGPPSLAAAGLRIEAWVARIARDEGFALNHRKTRCRRAGRRQQVCGIVVNRQPNLPREEFDRLKALLHRCVIDGPSAHNRDGHARFQDQLRGQLAWAAQLNAGKAQRLQRLFERIDWQR